MSELYNREFYETRHADTLHSANTILKIVREIIPPVRSATDIGCGVGTWLYTLQQMGAIDIQGIDGNWVKKDFLKIPIENFLEYDLNQEIQLNKKFDLAISLEVAEHIQPENAATFVTSLTNLSDFILFSAAIPYQSGVGHVNEQWLTYWISLFKKKGYRGIDVIRKKIWNDRAILSWYRQNTILFVKEERLSELKIANLEDTIPGEVYLLPFKKAIAPDIKQSLNYLTVAIQKRIEKVLSSKK
jgi:2-polyprenyl-3-methyl-5-hydroxy-6-metoxy-1,4-benzoquinol methylase